MMLPVGSRVCTLGTRSARIGAPVGAAEGAVVGAVVGATVGPSVGVEDGGVVDALGPLVQSPHRNGHVSRTTGMSHIACMANATSETVWQMPSSASLLQSGEGWSVIGGVLQSRQLARQRSWNPGCSQKPRSTK